MFAEELAGNASKKRAEQNRANRRQLKQQQQKKAPPSTPVHLTASSEQKGPSDAVTLATPSAQSSAVTGIVTLPTTAVVSTESKRLSAVEKAEQQRKIRAQAALLQKGAVRVQAAYRAYRSNQNVRQQQTKLLSQRLGDLNTLRNLLMQKTKAAYVPPPATTTMLVQQLLFLTQSIPMGGRPNCMQIRSASDIQVLLQQTLDYAIVPGIEAIDDNLFPFTVWIESSHGRYRLQELLRLAIVTATSTSLSDTASKAVVKFLRLVVGLDDAGAVNLSLRQGLVQHARSLLLPQQPVILDLETKVDAKVPPYARRGASLDLFAALRHYLLFAVAGPKPIPHNAENLREACVPVVGRIRGGAILTMVTEAVWATPVDAQGRCLQVRLVAEIMTVPLLTWKVSTESLAFWVQRSKVLSSRVPVVVLLQNFADKHSSILQAGNISSLLPSIDVPLTSCPSANTQCILANLIQLGRLCPTVSGVDPNQVDYTAASIFFDFVATLVDAVPLGTFSSNDSAVEWISDAKGHFQPVILSPVIIDQCKLLLVDSFVRRLLNCAIDSKALDTDQVLNVKSEKDKKHEKDLMDGGSTSAALLVAKEARIDRNRSFWNSSKW